MPGLKEFIIPVREEYEESVNIFDDDGTTTTVVRVSVVHVSVFASNKQEARQLVEATMTEWRRNKRPVKK